MAAVVSVVVSPRVRMLWLGPDDIAGEPDNRHMAADSELLERVGEGFAPPTLRCYGWKAPAVTIGRLQDEAGARSEFPGYPMYRRPTGGKAVLHGGDLTAAVAIRHGDLIDADRSAGSSGVLTTYLRLVEPLRTALAKFGVETKLGGNTEGLRLRSTIASENCFAATARCDVVEAKHGIKIVGSAMRRTRSAVLLQMSIPPISEIDLFGREFLDELRDQYARCLNIGPRDVVER